MWIREVAVWVSARVAGRTASLFGIHRYHIHRGYMAYGVSRRTARASAAAASQTRRAYRRRRRSAARASYTAWTLGQSHLALLLRVPQCATKNENTTRAFEVLPHAILLWGNDAPYNGARQPRCRSGAEATSAGRAGWVRFGIGKRLLCFANLLNLLNERGKIGTTKTHIRRGNAVVLDVGRNVLVMGHR